MTIIKGISGSAVLLAALSLPLQAAEPVKVGSKIDTEERCSAISFCRCLKATA